MLSIKELGKRLIRLSGYEVKKVQSPGHHLRPVGQLESVLTDFKARGYNPSIVFDCGASDGSWTAAVKPLFPNARFVLVEPRNISAAITVRAAVGAQEGSGTLTDWDTGSTLLPVPTGRDPQYAVPVTTLDRLAEQFGVPDLVKLDVEGFELEALRGGDSLFGRTDVFLIEVALYRFVDRPMLHDIVAYMASKGYFVYDIAGFIRRPYDGAVGLMDLCFARSLRGSETEWHAKSESKC